MKRAPRNRPAVVAEPKASVRTNVARAWHRAVGSMRPARAERIEKPIDPRTTKADAITLALATSPASRVIDTPIHWTVDVPETAPSESGVYANALHALSETVAESAESLKAVTLIVYGWSNVQPGTLAWVFPTARAAQAAARAMKNAIGWAILLGDHEAAAGSAFDLSAARDRGEVLLEQPV